MTGKPSNLPRKTSSNTVFSARQREKHIIEKNKRFRHVLNTITLSGSGKEYQVRTLPDTARSARAIEVKNSPRWITRQKFPTTLVSLPLIDKLGRYTGYESYRCKWSPASVISTTVATVFRRLFFWALNHNESRRYVYTQQRLLTQVAGYYTISKNSYFMDRVLFLLKDFKKNRRLIHGILFRYVSKLDAHKWFVYGHVCLQTQWLTSRALRPRDKLSFSREFCTPLRCRSGSKELDLFEYDAIWTVFTGLFM